MEELGHRHSRVQHDGREFLGAPRQLRPVGIDSTRCASAPVRRAQLLRLVCPARGAMGGKLSPYRPSPDQAERGWAKGCPPPGKRRADSVGIGSIHRGRTSIKRRPAARRRGGSVWPPWSGEAGQRGHRRAAPPSSMPARGWQECGSSR